MKCAVCGKPIGYFGGYDRWPTEAGGSLYTHQECGKPTGAAHTTMEAVLRTEQAKAIPSCLIPLAGRYG